MRVATPVFLTVDTELSWRHHADGCDLPTMVERSLEPAGVGVAYQLEQLMRHGLKASFFVDPMPGAIFGLDPFKRVVETIQQAGQRVQLHLHPGWARAKPGDGGASGGPANLCEYPLDEQRALIEQARELLIATGTEAPIAFRAGNYAANDDTLTALASLGFEYDSSHNGAEHPWPSKIGLPVAQISPIARAGLTEIPVTLIEERPGALRNFQICALSAGEMRAALDHAAAESHAAVTIVNHGFELANRAGTSPNAVHVRRFQALCALLEERRDVLPTCHFADRPTLCMDADDRPLGPNPLRLRWRQAEQLWSNMVAERAA